MHLGSELTGFEIEERLGSMVLQPQYGVPLTDRPPLGPGRWPIGWWRGGKGEIERGVTS